MRADRFLAEAIGSLSRSRVKALIEAGQATRDGVPVRDPAESVRPGARYRLRIPPPVPATPQPQAIPLSILFEDADLIVVDKPAGLVVHPAPGNLDGTLVNALLAHAGDDLPGIGGEKRPGIVHRLDKDTSGVMVVAKNDATHQSLSKLFAAHDLERIYTALVWGAPRPERGTIEAALGRHPVDRKRMAVRKAGGRAALTEYWLDKRFGPPLAPIASLVGAKLGTGRTHQVRVHMAHIGCPVVGDPVYGRKTRNGGAPEALKAFPRQALHASVLAFRHPKTGKNVRFTTELPEDFRKLLGTLNGVK